MWKYLTAWLLNPCNSLPAEFVFFSSNQKETNLPIKIESSQKEIRSEAPKPSKTLIYSGQQ